MFEYVILGILAYLYKTGSTTLVLNLFVNHSNIIKGSIGENGITTIKKTLKLSYFLIKASSVLELLLVREQQEQQKALALDSTSNDNYGNGQLTATGGRQTIF